MGKAIIDLAGQVFGRLMVINMQPSQHGHMMWLCKCSCGKEKIVSSNHLRSGAIRSCGCIIKDVCSRGPRPASIVDLVGQAFGKLTVLARDGYIRRCAAWICKCECGNEVRLPSSALRSRNTTSCGCNRKNHNHHWWKGGIAITNWGLRNSIQSTPEYKKWRTAIFHRDNFICQDCKCRGGNLQAHHIKPLQQLLTDSKITTVIQALACEELWSISNGVTLCVACHKKKTWGHM